MARPFVSIAPGAACIVGLSIVACTPYGEHLWALLTSGGNAEHHLRLAPGRQLSNRELLAVVNEHVSRSIEDMKTFVQQEVRAARPTSIVIHSARGSSFVTSLLKAALLAGAAYGLLRLSGYPVDQLLFVSKRALEGMVQPLLEKVEAVREAAEEGFGEVLHLVQNYRQELQDMRTEIRGKMEKVDKGVTEVHSQAEEVSAAMDRLDENINITNQGVRLICAVVAEHLPSAPMHTGLRSWAPDSIAHRMELLEGPTPKGAAALNARMLSAPLSVGQRWSGPSATAKERPEETAEDARKRITDIIASAKPGRPRTRDTS